MSERCTAIVPFRTDGGGERDANLTAVLRWLSRMPVDVIVVEHGPVRAPAATMGGSTQALHLASDGPFSKAAACNAGYRAASSAVLALVDADMMVSPGSFLGCVARVDEGVDVIRPFGRVVDMDRATTQRVRSGSAPWDQELVTGESDRDDEVVPLCGGLVIVRADAYERAGGMDESFAGWGGEDDALSTALARTGSDCRILRDGRGFHLWHDRSDGSRYAHQGYERNARRAAWWLEAEDADLARAVAAGRERLRRDQS